MKLVLLPISVGKFGFTQVVTKLKVTKLWNFQGNRTDEYQ